MVNLAGRSSVGSYDYCDLYGDSIYTSSYRRTSNETATTSVMTSTKRDITAQYAADFEEIKILLSQENTKGALEACEDVKDEMRKYLEKQYGDEYNKSMLKTLFNGAYESCIGESIYEAANYSSGSFRTGFFQGLPIAGMFANDLSSAEVIEQLTGKEIRFADKFWEKFGKVAGAMTSGGIVAGVAAAITAGFLGTVSLPIVAMAGAAAAATGILQPNFNSD